MPLLRIILTTIGILIVAATARMESSSRYHYDTLRQDRRWTLRLVGIPIPFPEHIQNDPYAGLYQEITGKAPDPQRWLQMPPDFIRYLWFSMELCHGSLTEERRQLLAAVYQKFRDGNPKAEAATRLERIDALLPMPRNYRQEIDRTAIDALRNEVGLK
jgi:hypothetical protein